MKSKNVKVGLIVAALVVAAISFWVWLGGGGEGAARSEERLNQERLHRELAPNESAPRSAGPTTSPR
jgi:hypothetical protein